MSELLAPEALPGWWSERGLVACRAEGSAVACHGPGGDAVIHRGWAGEALADGDLAALLSWARPPIRLALVLVRRGGYAAGLAEGARLVAHRCGSRYVQSRTAAGGWSQQRFARRRENQAAGLVEAAGDHLGRLLGEVTGEPASGAAQRWVDGLVLGGDRMLLADLGGHPVMVSLTDRPRRVFLDLPDPGLKVLRRTLWRARAVTVGGAVGGAG